MGKNKRRKGHQRSSLKNTASAENIRKSLPKKISSIILWLAATGILALSGNVFWDFLTGDVQVKYIKPSGKGYEFNIVNNSSADQIIKNFRISPDFGQGFLFEIDKSVYGELTENGFILPGGNSTYMPAFEYSEMNGYVLSAKSEVSFRVPPLVARDYMVPKSIVVFVDYSTKPNNKYLAKLESILSKIDFRDASKREKYLVVDNYWSPLSIGNQVDAIKNACRDDDVFSKSTICTPN